MAVDLNVKSRSRLEPDDPQYEDANPNEFLNLYGIGYNY